MGLREEEQKRKQCQEKMQANVIRMIRKRGGEIADRIFVHCAVEQSPWACTFTPHYSGPVVSRPTEIKRFL